MIGCQSVAKKEIVGTEIIVLTNGMGCKSHQRVILFPQFYHFENEIYSKHHFRYTYLPKNFL